MWKLMIDAKLTRRKTYHILYGPDGVEVFRSLTVSECLNYAIASDCSELALDHITLSALGAVACRVIIERQ